MNNVQDKINEVLVDFMRTVLDSSVVNLDRFTQKIVEIFEPEVPTSGTTEYGLREFEIFKDADAWLIDNGLDEDVRQKQISLYVKEIRRIEQRAVNRFKANILRELFDKYSS